MLVDLPFLSQIVVIAEFAEFSASFGKISAISSGDRVLLRYFAPSQEHQCWCGSSFRASLIPQHGNWSVPRDWVLTHPRSLGGEAKVRQKEKINRKDQSQISIDI